MNSGNPEQASTFPPKEREEPVLRASEEDRTFRIRPRETCRQTELWTQWTHAGSWLLMHPAWGMGAAQPG